ncbi:MAG TPA: ABC transporter ATP-binding protein [Armatimonadota bacterium]
MAGELAVEAVGLRKAFGPVTAVRSLDLAVPTGEIVGLVGPDGAGKTTSLRMLCGILDADGGEARVAGHDVRRDPEGVKARLGYLPQRFSLHRDLTVFENVAYFADLYSLPVGTWRERRDELLEMTDLARFHDRLAGALSGGMKQKLALVCTLIHRPQVLLLDEPTTGVDPVSRRDFWKILYDLPRQGVTMLISTPYMDEAVRCNRVAFMYEGALLVQDTPAALRDALTSRILELRCHPQHVARETLKLHPEVEGVEVFGDRLHVALRPTADPNGLVAALSAAQVACSDFRETPPSLEDVFVALTARGAGGG